MADRRRRRSPAQSHSSSRRKYDSRRSTYEEIVPEPIPQQTPSYLRQQSYEPADMRSFSAKDAERERERAAAYPSSFSSSSSSSYIDISRTFPPNRSGIRTFFTAPSEHRRKLRRRRSSRLFKIANSSSSSVNSDLAYGTGYIKRPKSRVRSRKGKEIDRERYYGKERHGYVSDREQHRDRTNAATNTTIRNEGRDGRSGLSKAATDAEILAVGAGLAKLAREQNKLDLKAARSGKKPEVFITGGNAGLSSSRGLGNSKVSHGSDTYDEDGWESASDDGSDFSVDSRLAYDNNTKSRWSLFGRKKFKPLSQKNTIVDPRLFGPANSLHGIVTQPVGFGEVSGWTSVSDFGQQGGYSSTPGPVESRNGSQQSLQQVYPIPTSDPEEFAAGRASRSSMIPGSEPPSYVSSRPGPIPLQQPQPITPVSQSVYQPIYSTSRSESGSILKNNTSSSRTPSLAQAALVGVAGAAVGAAIASNRDDKKDRQREEELRDKERQKRRDSEKAESARENERRETERRDLERRDLEKRELERRDKDRREADRREFERRDLERRELEKKESERRRDKRDSPDRDDRKDKRRDKKDDNGRDSKRREKRRDDTRDEKDERRERRRDERRSERGDRIDDRVDVRPVEERRVERPELVDRRTKSEASMSSTSVDPFQFQVKESAFDTPISEAPVGGHRPTVVTVEREPDFSRVQSYSVRDPKSGSDSRIEVEYSDKDERERRSGGRGSRDAPLHEAEETYHEISEFTAPIAVAAIGAAIAAENHRESRSEQRRDERRSGSRGDYDKYDRGKGRERDLEAEKIQEEADRAYREIVMARKIASQVIRSRTPSPDRSVVDKYDGQEEEEIVRIVTPPGMEEHKKKGPYDAPNADFQLDHVIEPKEMQMFNVPTFSYNRAASEPVFLKRDPGAERPRPLLNLVYPTPTPSPVPEKQKERSEVARSPAKPKEREKPRVNTSDVVIGPRGNIIASPTTSTVSKGVTWGENETKHFEVESPHEHKDEFVSAANLPSREVPQEIKSSGSKSKGWGAIAAGIMGAGIGAVAANGSDTSKLSKSKKDNDEKSYEYRGVVVEPDSPPRRKSPPRREREQSPPSPGPKPTSPRSTHIPGAFDDDLDFTATVAAGLQDTGFDPNMVINDPSFRRRDSPPGSNGPTLYHAPFAETVSDLGAIPPSAVGSVGSGFILGEVTSTPRDWQSVSPPTESTEASAKLSKKEQKKLDKQRRQSGDVTPLEQEDIPAAREIVEEPNDYFYEPKLSKKEQKKRDKEAARQAALAEEVTPTVLEEIVESPQAFEIPKKSKKSKKTSSSPDEIIETSRQERTVSVPVDAFDDLKNGDDDWTDTKTKKKKRDSERYESPPRSTPIYGAASEIGEISRSKRDSERYESPPRSRDAISDVGLSSSSKNKSKRDNERFESPPRPKDVVTDIGRSSSSKEKSKRDGERFESPARSRDAVSDIGRSSSSNEKSRRRSEQYERDPEEVSLPPSTPSEASRDGDYDERRSRKSSNRDSGIFSSADRDFSQSVVSADASRYDDGEPRKKKKSRSGRDDFDDTRSVASAPAGDEYEDSKKSKKKDKDKDKKSGIFSSIFGSKSESGARDESPKSVKDDDDKKKSKKSKRHSMPDSSSIYSGIGTDSVADLSRSVSNGSHGKHHFDDDLDDGVRSDGEKRRKSRSRSGSTTSTKKDSFLGNAGILGAGAGIAGAAAVAIAAQQYQQSKAANTNNQAAEHIRSMSAERPMDRDEILDPEISERQFRPSIDPQYGDLLPLPPSDPASPNNEPLEELPELPESRPETPDAERVQRDKGLNALRRSLQETPMKSPSHSAVPLVFKMGNRSIPSSPGLVRSSPGLLPATPNAEGSWSTKVRPTRPTSWDKSTEYKPLWLPEVTRRGSTTQVPDSDNTYPELPESEATSRSSRSSSLLDFQDAVEHSQPEPREHLDSLSIDTKLASAATGELLDSTQTTPKAASFSKDISGPDSEAEFFEEATHFEDKPSSVDQRPASVLENEPHSSGKDVAAIAAGAGLVSALGYFASAPSRTPMRSDWMDELPSVKRDDSSADQPYPSEHELPMVASSSIPRQPSPIDPVTKDRSSYLLRSSPMSRKLDDENDTLQNIQERDDHEPGTITEALNDIEDERQRALETLSTPREQVEDPFKPTVEPGEAADEFILKSKKDKKKDKKKSKGLSRSSTQDDFSLAESSRDIEPESQINTSTAIPAEEEPIEEFVTSKSKKNKKKDKTLSRSSTQNDLTSFSAAQDVVPDTTSATTPAEDFFTTKSKKDEKKDKKKGKSTTDWDPEPIEIAPAELVSDNIVAPESSVSRDIQEEAVMPMSEESTIQLPIEEPTESFAMPKSKKDKKKKKSAIVWEPEPTQDVADQPPPSTSVDLLNETTLRDSTEVSEVKGLSDDSPAAVLDQGKDFSDEFSTSKSEKGKGKEFSSEQQKPSDISREEDSAAARTPALEDPTPLTRDFQEAYFDQPIIKSESTSELPSVVPSEASAPKLKKDKKKRKSLLSWGAWGADSNEPATESPGVPVEESSLGDLPTSSTNQEQPSSVTPTDVKDPEVEPIEEFSTPKSKKDKKKDKKKKTSLAWEPEPDNFEDAQEQIQEPLPEMPVPKTLFEHEKSSSHDIPSASEQVSTTNEEVVPLPIQSQTSVDLPLSRDIEDPSELLLPAMEPELRSEAPFPAQEEPDSWAFSTTKKEKKKDKKKKNKSFLTWPEDEEEIKPSEEHVAESSENVSDKQANITSSNDVPTVLTSAEPELASAHESKQVHDDFHEATEPVTGREVVEEPVSRSADEPFTEPQKVVEEHDSQASVPLPTEVPGQIPADESVSKEIDLLDDFATKSVKDKKKSKKKSKSALVWEPEEEQSGSQTPPASGEPSRDVSEQPSAVEDSEKLEDFTSSKSKKDKKDRKKGKAFVPWDEPEPEQQSVSETTEGARDIVEAIPASIPAVEPEDDFASFRSKKDRKKDKKKGKATAAWDESQIDDQSIVLEPTLEVAQEVEKIIEAAPAAEDEFPTFVSRKDKKSKKKGKASISWEPEPDTALSEPPITETPFEELKTIRESTMPEVVPEEDIPTIAPLEDQERDKEALSSSSRDLEPETQVNEKSTLEMSQPAQELVQEPSASVTEFENDFPVFASKKDKKKDKKKGKSSSSWEPEPESQIDDQTTSEASQLAQDLVREPAAATVEPEDDFPTFTSKKDKKKDKKKGKSSSSSWEPEPESQIDNRTTSEALEQVQDLAQETAAATVEPEDDFPTFTSKKDKKKDKKKAKSAATPDLDEPAFSEAKHQPGSDAGQEVPESSSTTFDESTDAFSTSKSKKDKKKGKKSRSVLAWDAPEEETETNQQILPEPSGEIIEEPSSISFGGIVPQDDISQSGRDTEVKANEEPQVQELQTSRDLAQEPLQDASNIPLPIKDGDELQESALHQHQDRPTTGDPSANVGREAASNAPYQTDINDPSLPLTAEAVVAPRNISVERHTKHEESSLPEFPSTESQFYEQIIEPETSTPEDYTILETKKSKKNKKKGKAMNWEPEQDKTEEMITKPSSDIPRDIELSTKDIPQEEPRNEEFITKSSKKDKKKKGKSNIAWDPEPEASFGQESDPVAGALEASNDRAPETPPEDTFVVNESKKGKKKKVKTTTSWEEPEAATTPTEQVPPEPLDDFTTQSSKKGKKKSRKSQAWDDDELLTGDVAQDTSKVAEDPTFPAPGIDSTKATPIGGTPKEEVSGAGGKNYFSSVADALPVATVGVALISAESIHNKSTSDKSDEQVMTVESQTTNKNNQPEIDTGSKLAPDGFAAGYDNDQLSLARQLQEEFSSGSKKSKKDKSKRKSLPATPARQESRSRAIDELSDDHHRARSLSIEPSVVRYSASPGIGERPSLYSEEQLELARQLKEEFGSGSKKSKKDKKKKRDISQDPADEDAFPQNMAESPQISATSAAGDVQHVEPSETPHGDGFAAGYQEDQLSLARQLQAEFGKKSKKDKKRRSTSQTPVEQEPAVDYFGETSQRYSEPAQYESSRDIPGDVQDKEYSRDGLAVGYNEDQLELARQLKEEFGSGSKKKSKKDKKRQSLLRGTTEDDFSSDALMAGSEPQSGLATPFEESTREAAVEPEDEFATVSKKSKKDKKGKKRETSLIRGTADEDLTIAPEPDVAQTLDENDPSRVGSNVRGVDEPAIAEPEDDFAPITKKSKKDKKGKKRESMVPAEQSQPEESFQDTEISAQVLQPETTDAEPVQTSPAEPKDEFAFVSKKSKKDNKGKKRDSIAPAEEIQPEASSRDLAIQNDVPQPESTETEPDQNFSMEPEDDFAPVSKKGKKNKKSKKRDSLLPDTLAATAIAGTLASGFGEEPASTIPITDTNETERNIDLEPPSQATPELPAEDDFGFPVKKSKKDKKGRKNKAGSEEISIQPELEPEPATEELSTADVTVADSGADATAELGELSGGRKLSKKDKKRQSLLRSATFDEPSESATDAKDDTEKLSEAVVTAPSNDAQDDGFDVPTKKAKKDKSSKRNSRRASYSEDAPIQEEPSPSFGQPEASNDQTLEKSPEISAEDPADSKNIQSTHARDVSITQLPVEQFDEPASDMYGDFAFTKKSKKDKKKRKDAGKEDFDLLSSSSKPMDHGIESKGAESIPPEGDTSEELTREQEPSISDEQPLNTDREVIEEPTEEWGSFSTKKSKKDKKKASSRAASEGPSGTVTPSEAVVDLMDRQISDPLAANFQEPVSFGKVDDGRNEETSTSAKDGEDLDTEWGSVSTKKSKKDKKKRKSGLSTPVEESVSSVKQHVDEVAESSANKDLIEQEMPSKEESYPSQDQRSQIDSSHEVPTSADFLLHPQALEPLLVQEHEALIPEKKDIIPEPEDDWDAVPKKSKKDKKKRKSGLSTAVEEPIPAIEQQVDELAELSANKNLMEQETPSKEESSSQDQRTPTDLPHEVPDFASLPKHSEALESVPVQDLESFSTEKKDMEPEDNWDAVPKKSKKDKKRKSGLSTPIEDAVANELSREAYQEPSLNPIAPEPATQMRETTSQPILPEEDSSLVEPEGEWGSLSRKVSKKDKKKKKSGLSTPVDESPSAPLYTKEAFTVEPTPSSELPQAAHESIKREIVEQDPTAIPQSSAAEVDEEWGTPTRKPSKKDKKKRKSGLSTQMEEPIDEPIIAEPSITTPAEFGQTTNRIPQADHETIDSQIVEPAAHDPSLEEDLTGSNDKEVPSIDPADLPAQELQDEFGFAVKKSKKDKKGKKASRNKSEPEPSSFVALGSSGPIDLFPKNEAPKERSVEVFEQQGADRLSSEQSSITRDTLTTDASPDISSSTRSESKDVSDELFRRPSKKDKRKRQTVPLLGADEGLSTAKAPVTSWADEVEEAEVVRDHPIIEDLAEDESLSHIPSTTEMIPTDDFVRPSKKGKKGKKRDSGQGDSIDITPPPTGKDISRNESSTKSSDIPGFAALAASAGLAGATLFGKVKESPENTSTSGTSTPVRKLSKKEKRKQSIDKRAVREDDIFDDPALWEGEKPRAYEDSKDQDDEDDGFWSLPHQEEQIQETRGIDGGDTLQTDEMNAKESLPDLPTHSTPQQLFPTIAPDAFSKLEEEDDQPRDYPTPVSPSQERQEQTSQHGLFHQNVMPISRDSEGVTRSPESRDHQATLHQNKAAESTYQPHRAEAHVSTAITPPGERNISFEDTTSIRPEQSSTPHRDYPESRDADRSMYDSPVDYRQSSPLSSRKYGRLSDLPVVHEEHLESEQQSGDPYHNLSLSHRDSAYESPIPPQKGFSDLHEYVRDSGVHLRDSSPADKERSHGASSDDAIARLSWPPVDEESETVDLHKSQKTKVSSKKRYDDGPRSVEIHDSPRPEDDDPKDIHRVQYHAEEKPILHHSDHLSSRDTLPSQQLKEKTHTELHRTPTVHGGRRGNQGSLVQQRLQKFESPDTVRSTPPRNGNIVKQRVQEFQTPESQRVLKLGPETPDLPPPAFETPKSVQSDKSRPSLHESPSFERSKKLDKYASLTSSERPKAEKPKGISDLEAGVALAGAATLGFAAARKLSQEQRPGSAQSIRSSSGGVGRLRTPDLHRPDSVNSNRSGTPPLRRSDRKVADLRSLSQRSKPDLAKEAELAAITASAVNTANPTANEGRVRAKDMADVYDGFGEGRMGSPRSPTRPHSMRRRQSMQVLELENRVEQLAADNRMLAEFKAQAERNLHASQTTASALVEKDAEIDALKRTLDWLQNEVTRLTEVNEGLTSANTEIARQHADRYGMLETQHAQATRELEQTREAHTNLSSGVEGMVKTEVQRVVFEKDQQIAQLRAELDAAKEKIWAMQREILASKANNIDFLTVRDEDYFDNACQKLCEHVQQWVLRFSKFSDMRACRLTREINNDKTIDRLDNAILDGSDVDIYLADRVKRRDIFMSMTMSMVWEFVFTRYLFGMDREQRQKLKALEKTLSEVGPASAVHAWRATTLTLLSKREAFQEQRKQDTQAVVLAIMETLSEILPPPSHLEPQIQEQLTRVMRAAVDLSIEMRCQRAEYMMLPPLQPEYDANGDLASKVSFNAALMNERSGDTVSNEDLENQKAVVRIVLFPLVVKKGDDSGEGDEEIVVCPAQVLVARSKKARFTETAQSNHSRMSMQSSMPVDAGDENVI